MICPTCQAENNFGASFCQACGRPMMAGDTRREPVLGSGPVPLASMPPDFVDPASDEDLLHLAVGDRNRAFYLTRFANYRHAGTTALGWNWPAFFFTFFWLLYRKLWGKAALYFFIPYIAAVGIGIAAAVSPVAGGIGYLVFLLAVFLVPPLLANGWYFRHCESLVERAKASVAGSQARLAFVASKGGTSNVAVILVVCLFIPAVIGILAAIALPAYQDFTTRAKVSGALHYGRTAAAAVGAYYEQRQSLPASLDPVMAASGLPRPAGLQSIEIDPQGQITIKMAPSPIQGKAFRLVPTAAPDRSVTWQCQAVDLAAKFLPQECR